MSAEGRGPQESPPGRMPRTTNLGMSVSRSSSSKIHNGHMTRCDAGHCQERAVPPPSDAGSPGVERDYVVRLHVSGNVDTSAQRSSVEQGLPRRMRLGRRDGRADHPSSFVFASVRWRSQTIHIVEGAPSRQ